MLRRYLFLAVFLVGSLLTAEESKILRMDGPYDLNRNEALEFLALESVPPQINQCTILRYYELDSDGYQNLLWELTAQDGLLGQFVNATIGDLNGDGNPELIVVMNVAGPGNGRMLQPSVLVYPWGTDGFSEDPSTSLNLAPDQPFILANNFQLPDIDADGDQEIAVSLGTPLRQVKIIDMNPEGALYRMSTITSNAMRTGSGFVYVAAVDHDRDRYDDLILFTREGNTLKAQAFYNAGGTFEPGVVKTRTVDGLNKLLANKIAVCDWDADGFRDVLLPFQSGHILALTLTPENLVIDELPDDGGPLSDMNIADFNQDGLDDILLVSGEMNLMTLITGADQKANRTPDYFSLEGETENMQVFTSIPLIRMGIYLGSIVGAGWDGQTSAVFISDLGQPPKPEPTRPQPAEKIQIGNQAELLAEFPELTPEQFSLPQIPRPIRTSGQALPAGVLPRHVLPVNRSFAYTIPEKKGNTFYSFRWLQPPPKGMFFHYDSKSIMWTPDVTQLGAFQLAYRVEMRIGESVKTESAETDSLKSYVVKPELEGYDEHLWIYVNDPPVFMSQPAGTEFVAKTAFDYRPVIRDRNLNDPLHMDLEVAPAGMTLTDGLIHWQTDSSHVSVYDVRIVASDGFDRTAQEFKLFARAGVRIISRAISTGSVNELYTYQTDVWHQNLDKPVVMTLANAPKGMTLSPTGLVEWTPAATQIDSQRFAIVARQGVATDTQRVVVFINHPPVLVAVPPPMNLVRVGDTWDFQLKATDPNKNDKLTYTAVVMPEGMRMDPFTGRLKWDPTSNQTDFSHLLIEITDGRVTRKVEADFYVNAPIRIVSIPVMQATVGEEYTHKIMTTDRNRSILLPSKKVVKIIDAANSRLYSINISDDIYRENIERYIGDWENAETVYLTDPKQPTDGQISRLNLKKYVQTIFYEDDRLNIIVNTIDERTVNIKDVLWEFFQGSQGKPPRVVVEKRSMVRYTLIDFPDGMVVDELTGTIHWKPTKDQADKQKVTIVASDGYSKDEQSFEIYANYPPVIISRPPAMGLVGAVYKYQVQVEDINKDAYLEYTLIKGPQGMQMSRDGKIVWIPEASQINTHVFELKVSDGYKSEIQNQNVFVNIAPTVISKPKPVGLTGYDYSYKLTAEDLNKDKVTFRPVRLPKYAKFNQRTGLLQWKPRNNQVGPNDLVFLVIDEHGATTTHEFQIHVFADPSSRQFVNTSWPLMLTFVGVMFAWGISQM